MSRRGDATLWALGIVLGLACLQFLPFWAAGLSPFWGDLTYIHHPWRALPAQMLQQGHLPLWNPYLYFGMPMAAQMQGSLFYPGTVPFFLFGFATATALFHILQYGLAGVFMFLWLRRSAPAAASLGGAVAFALGGGMMSRMPFLNHLGVLSLMPAFLLFFESPWALALSLGLAFLAGYPPFLPGAVLVAWALHALLGGRLSWARAREWVGAGVLSSALSACLLVPAWELSALCRRSSGMELSETLRFGYGFSDLVQWVSPLLVPWKAFDPAVEWWKCSYLGFSGLAAAILGLLSLPRKRAALLCGLLLIVAALILGDSNPASLLLWAKAAPLKFVRYPGNMFYLALPALSLLIAAGLSRSGHALLFAVMIAAELSFYGMAKAPRVPSGIFTAAGPLVRGLQGRPGQSRYLLSPLALHQATGAGVLDWKTRLYGLTNAPFRLRSAGNFGEPLVPRDSYDYMDALFSAKGADKAAALFGWGNIDVLMTRDPLPDSRLLAAEPTILWPRYRYARPVARAYGFDKGSGDRIPPGLPGPDPPLGRPLASESPREDRFTIAGDFAAPGWVFVSEPRYPGWKAYLKSGSATVLATTVAAAKAFQKTAVPAGPWRLFFLYDPQSFRLGLLISGGALLAAFLYWYNCKIRIFDEPS